MLGSPKTATTPKPPVDGEGKQGSLRGSKRLSVKGNVSTSTGEDPSPDATDEQPEVCGFFA
jgi:hypothetical protein